MLDDLVRFGSWSFNGSEIMRRDCKPDRGRERERGELANVSMIRESRIGTMNQARSKARECRASPNAVAKSGRASRNRANGSWEETPHVVSYKCEEELFRRGGRFFAVKGFGYSQRRAGFL